MQIREMTIEDYDEVFSLWRSVEGMGLHGICDSEEGVGKYLRRNPGLSFVARDGNRLIGAVLCGHDGRRGYLHHLAVDREYRRKGIGTALVAKVIEKLNAVGIGRCHIFIFAENTGAQEFWQKSGWTEFVGLKIMSRGVDLNE